jgi:MFS family permease
MTLFVIILNIPGVLVGYAMAYQNQVSTCFNVKFNWTTQKEQNRNQAIIGGAVVLGMTIGAVCGGYLMKLGRRRAVLISALIGLAGIAITIHLEFTTLLIGRFLYGLGAGLFSSICPRYLEETTPSCIYD